MDRQVIDNKRHILHFKPLHCEETKEYNLDSPGEGYSPIKFWTATADMRMVNKNGVLYIEHLKVDGRMELLLYKGVHAGNDNFINFGWQKGERRIYMRVDIYTGDSLIMES